MKKTFEVVIEQDEDGIFVASVPELPGCHTQGDSLVDVKVNAKEAIEAYLESMDKDEKYPLKFVKIQKIEIAV